MKQLNKLEESVILQALSIYYLYIDGHINFQANTEDGAQLLEKTNATLQKTLAETGFDKEPLFNVGRKLRNADVFTL